MLEQPHFPFSVTINLNVYVPHFLQSFLNPEWFTADAAEKPAVLLYFLSFWCLVWTDSNPMSHWRQQVPTWLPQWHAVQCLTRLHNSVRLLLSHQPCFIATVTSDAVYCKNLSPTTKWCHSVKFCFPQTGMLNQTDRKHTPEHTHSQNQWGKTENDSNEVGSMKKCTGTTPPVPKQTELKKQYSIYCTTTDFNGSQ